MSAQHNDATPSVWTASGVWIAVAAAVVALATVLHAVLPRYTMTTAGTEGAVVLVFDHWTGQFQRATYGADGEPKVTQVVKPF